MKPDRTPADDDHFGTDFLAFLLIIFGAMGMIGGLIWLVCAILQALH